MSPQLLETLSMFAFLAIELSALFIGVSLLVGALQRHIPAERIQVMLSASKRRSYFLAAGLGAITPFCSCSTIPLLKGLIRARAGFGPMMVFLFTSPLLNPIIVVLLAVTFGVKLTVTYVIAALLVSLTAGWLLQTLGFERYVRSQPEGAAAGCGASTKGCGPVPAAAEHETAATSSAFSVSQARFSVQPPQGLLLPQFASDGAVDYTAAPSVPSPRPKGKYSGLWQESWSDFIGILPYLFIGVAIGSVIYGFMPTGLLEQYAGQDNPLAIPVAAVIGVPLYIRAEAVIPLAGALMAKGVGAGTVLALIIGSAGASLTELILLRSLFSYKLLAAFVATVFAMAVAAGYATFVFF